MHEHNAPLETDHIINSDLSQENYLDDQGFNWKTGEKQTATSITPSVVTDQPGYGSSIGWLTMSFTVKELSVLSYAVKQIVIALIGHLSDQVVDENSTYRGYRQAIRFASGAVIAYSKIRRDFILVLEQSVCERIHLSYLLLLIKDFVDNGGRITRLDLTCDDFTCSLVLKEIFEAYQAGCMVARTKYLKYDNGFSSPSEKSEEIIRIGKRSSQFHTRIYNKTLESEGRLEAIRFESELKQDLAHHSFAEIFKNSFSFYESISSPNPNDFDQLGFNHAILAIIAGKVEFKDPASDSNVTRRTRLFWWDQFLQGIVAVKVTIPKMPAKIATISKWFLNSVVTSLALLVASQSGDVQKYLEGLINLGHTKFKARHKILLKEAENIAKSKPDFYKTFFGNLAEYS